MVERAKVRFGCFEFQVTAGTKYLGGFVGTTTDETSHIQAKVSVNTTLTANFIDRLANVVSNLMSLLLLSILVLYVSMCTSSTIILCGLFALRST